MAAGLWEFYFPASANASTKDDMTKNPWHMALLLGYSESYLQGLPSWLQEPLINSLAKIAQWKGADKDLYKYFK